MKKELHFWILVTLLFAVGGACAQVELLPNTPNDIYFCVSHPTPGIVYLAGNQAVCKSYDNGDSWETVFTFDSSFSSRFFGIWFWDEQTGFATCATNDKNASVWAMSYDIPPAPLLFKTEDGGVSWQCIDTIHFFTNIQFINQDTLFALEYEERALYKSVDGGNNWSCVLSGPNIFGYSVVNSQIVYALQPTGYMGGTQPTPRVYKSSNGGEDWMLIFSPVDNGKGPMTIDLIYFWEEGKGSLSGHQMMFTDDDFATYDLVGTNFSSDYPRDDNFQSICLKSGFRVLTSWDDHDIAGLSKMYISRDFGRHRKSIAPNNLPYFTFIGDLSGCEADTTFYITSGLDFNNCVYRLRGTDFPNVGVPERPAMKVQFHPNPTDDLLFIELSNGAEISNITLYDLHGRTVYSPNSPNSPMSMKSVPAGVYVLRVTDTDGREYHQKVVKK